MLPILGYLNELFETALAIFTFDLLKDLLENESFNEYYLFLKSPILYSEDGILKFTVFLLTLP